MSPVATAIIQAARRTADEAGRRPVASDAAAGLARAHADPEVVRILREVAAALGLSEADLAKAALAAYMAMREARP